MTDRYSMLLPNDPQQYPATGYEWAEEDSEEPTAFCIDSDAKADWALRKIAEEKAELDRLDALAAQRIEEIESKMEKEQRRYEQHTSYLRAALEEYFNTVPHRDTKTKSTYKLLSGSLVRKKGGTDYKRDNDTLTDWMESNGYGDMVKVKREPQWGAFKRLLEPTDSGAVFLADTGEIVPGITAERKPDTFEIKF